MAYTEIHARRLLAKKLFEAQSSVSNGAWSSRWADAAETVRREYERDVEKLFNPNDQEVHDALAVLGWRHDKRA